METPSGPAEASQAVHTADSLRAAGRNACDEWCEEDVAGGAQRLPYGDPEQWLSACAFFNHLEQCMRALPRQAARVFVLRDIMGLNVAETCRELAISATSCSVILHRARMRLRAQLSAAGYGARGAA